MADDAVHALLRTAEGKQFRFTFTDGEEMLADVVSASHVDANDTIVVLRVGAGVEECGWQVHFADIRSVATPDGRLLYTSS
jgi:hypothetical protein